MGNAINPVISVTVLACSAVFANPSNPEDSKDLSSDESGSDKTDTDSGESSEDSLTQSGHVSTAKHPEKGPPLTQFQKTSKSVHHDDLSQYRTATPEDYPTVGPPTAQYLPPRHEAESGRCHSDIQIQSEPSLDQGDNSRLSSRCLSTDARTCQKRKHKRQDRTASKSKTETGDDVSLEEANMSSIVDRNGDKCQQDSFKKPKDDIDTEKSKISSEQDADIQQFILEFINKAGIPESEAGNVKFFDAAIVYDPNDYQEVNGFRFDVKAIVEARLHEKIEIELFDSMAFAQSKVLVVEDVIERCSVVFIYLTKNCNQETFRLFCDEGIGITRLGLTMQGGPCAREKQWVIKPVHTQPLKQRQYKTPVGLVSLQGIDWYDKDSAHTRDRLVSIMEHAVQQRKRKERQATSTHVDSRKLEEKILRSSQLKSGKGKQYEDTPEEFSSMHKHSFDNPSIHEDAMSFPGQNSSYGSLPNSQLGAGQSFSIQNQQMPNPMQTVPGYPSYPYPMPFAHNPSPQFMQINGQPYLVGPLSNHGAQYSHSALAQQGIPAQIPPNYAQQPYPYAPQMYQPVQQQVLPQPNQAQFQHGYGYQQHPPPAMNTPAPVIQSAGPYQHQQPPYQNNSNTHPNNAPTIPNQQVPQNYQSQSVPAQVPANPTYRNAPHTNAPHPNASSVPGDYMRDRRNDAPPDSELSVVSRIDGRLIVNPNLSTDDIEVDEPSGRGEAEFTSSSTEHRRSAGSSSSNRHHNQHHPRTEDCSSSDDDSDMDIPVLRGKPKSRKAVTIYGCKNVQLGSDNKVVENKEQRRKRRSKRKSSSEAETSGARGASMNSLKKSGSQQESQHNGRRDTTTHSTRSSVYEDNLDVTLASEQSGHIAHATRNGTPDQGLQLLELKDIDSEMYHRRQQKRSLTETHDASPVPVPQQGMNCLDKPDSSERQLPCRTEVNMLDSFNNLSLSEIASDDHLFGEGQEVFDEAKPMASPSQNNTSSAKVEVKESKIQNQHQQEACFSFSKFQKSRQKPVSVPVQAEAGSSGDQSAELDELD